MSLDPASLVGLVIGVVALFGTQLVEGGHPASLLQLPAALIVGIGTLGATLLSCTTSQLECARRELRRAFRPAAERAALLPGRFRYLAFVARKDGLIALDQSQRALPTPFMRRAMRHLIDGCDERQLRDILCADARARSGDALAAARVFEVAGGYAPTMGILGAVLGLVRAMEALADPDALGAGIATAFIATIYGVAGANLVLLPIATKIRERARRQEDEDAIVIEGMVGLQSGISPRTLERILQAHLTREEPA
ncbi:MAG: flagellar motor protein [Myxococcota bacterium]